MMHGFQLDPLAILGVAPGASVEAIRDAYREKSKKHHPDHGGDEWAFRVVVRAYEILSSAAAANRDAPRANAPAAPAPASAATGADRVRPGVHDKLDDLSQLIDVEILWCRFAVADLFELVGGSEEDQNLSGSINLTWPSAEHPEAAADPAVADEILRKLDHVFDDMRVQTRVVSSRCKRDANRFTGWLSYPSGDRAWKAFKVLHESLKARGLGVRQWTRDMIIPKA